MSLVKSLNSGVSGLRAFQTKMDVIGNNIANVETAGYKSSSVTFAEMMSERLGRAGGGGDNSPQLYHPSAVILARAPCRAPAAQPIWLLKAKVSSWFLMAVKT